MTGLEPIVYLAIAGTAVASYGTYQSGKQSQQQVKAQAAWNNYNS